MPTSRCHKNDCRSSSESYTSDSNKCIEDKNKKLKEQPNKKSSKPTRPADEKVADKQNAKKSPVEATPKKSADIPFPEQIADESENNNEA